MRYTRTDDSPRVAMRAVSAMRSAVGASGFMRPYSSLNRLIFDWLWVMCMHLKKECRRQGPRQIDSAAEADIR